MMPSKRFDSRRWLRTSPLLFSLALLYCLEGGEKEKQRVLVSNEAFALLFMRWFSSEWFDHLVVIFLKVTLFHRQSKLRGREGFALRCCSSFCFFFFFDFLLMSSHLLRPCRETVSALLFLRFWVSRWYLASFDSLLPASSNQSFFLFESTVESYNTAYVLLCWVKAAGDHQTCFALGRMLTEMCLVRQRTGRHRRAFAPFRFFRESLLLRKRSQTRASHYFGEESDWSWRTGLMGDGFEEAREASYWNQKKEVVK